MLDDDLPTPPAYLFKYLPRARADVIENLRIRFTPLLATNDIFEIRRTFKKIAGPKFYKLLSEQSVSLDPNQTATEEIMKISRLDEKSARELAINLLTQKFGPAYKDSLQKIVRGIATDVVVPTMNRDDTIEQILTNLGGGLVALSLSEDPKNSAM
jgi:hypothetical protein